MSTFFIHSILFSTLFLTTALQAAEPNTTSFAVGRYANNRSDGYSNNLNLNKTLSLPNAEALEVTVIGETEEGYDFVTLYDGNKRVIRRFSGPLDETFTLKGSTLSINFSSDNRTTKEGVLIKITSSSLFNEIKTRLLDTARKILKEGTSEANDKLGRKRKEFQQLQTEVQTQTIDSVIDKATAELLALTHTYRSIANLNEEVMAIHQNQFKVLEGLREESKNYLEKLKQEQKTYSDRLGRAKTRLADATLSAFDQQKEKLAIEVYEGILEKLRKQQENWESFDQAQHGLEKKLQEYSERVGLLLYFLGINAQLYQQAANVALMKKEHITELNNLTNLAELQEMVTNITSKEEEIRQLMDKLQQTDFEQP